LVTVAFGKLIDASYGKRFVLDAFEVFVRKQASWRLYHRPVYQHKKPDE